MLRELSVVEQRYQAVLEVVRDGLQVTEVAERYGVSRQSVHAWLRRYATGGLDALADRSHRPRGCPHQTAAEVQTRICELRRQHPEWGPRRLGHELRRGGLDTVPSRSSIYRTLVRAQLIEPVGRRRRRVDYRRWERARPMELWQMDVMGGVWLVDGRELKVVTGVDDHSRYCVAAGLVERATSRAVCRILSAALDRYGVPDELLTDNGKVFTGRFGPHPGEVLLERICRQQGITHLLTGVRCPTTTGKIERFHKTLRTELFTGRRYQTLAQAQEELDAWVTEYNTHRPHQALGMAAPAARFQPASEPSPRPTANAVGSLGPGHARGLEITRIVSSTGCIKVAYQRFSVGRALGGHLVTVRVEPTLLQVFFRGQLVRSVPRVNDLEVIHTRAKTVRPRRTRPKTG